MEQLPLRERNKLKIAQRIIAAAVDLFKSRGYTQTTIDDIADRAEVSRRTLFNYFPSKEALLLPWAQEILSGHIYPTVRAYLATEPTAIDGLRLLFSVISETILAAPDVVHAFMHESLQANNISHQVIVGNGVQEIFLEVVRYGQARGEVRSDLPAEQLAFYLSALQAPLLFNLLQPGEVSAAPPDFDTLLAFIQTGLRAEE